MSGCWTPWPGHVMALATPFAELEKKDLVLLVKACVEPVSVVITSNVNPLQDEYVREIFFFNMVRCLLWRRANCEDHPFESAYLSISFASEVIQYCSMHFWSFFSELVQAAMENGYGSAPSRAITLQAEAPISKSADEMFLILSFFSLVDMG